MFSINLEPAWDSLQQIVEHERFELHSVRYCRNGRVEVQLVRKMIHTMLTNMRMRGIQLQCPAKKLYMGERFHSQTFANTTKKSNSMGSMGFVCCRKLALNIAFAFWSLVPFVFDAWVVLLIRHPFGNGPGKDLSKTTTSTTTTWCLGLRQLLCLGCARWWLWRLWRVSWAQFMRT